MAGQGESRMTGKRRLWLISVGLISLLLLSLMTWLTIQRRDRNQEMWRESLTKQGSFILGAMDALNRSGGGRMRHMIGPEAAQARFQYLVEELGRVGLVESLVIVDQNGQVIVSTDPAQIGQPAPGADQWWDRLRQAPEAGGFGPEGFEVIRLLRPMRMRQVGPRAARVILPLDEFRAAQKAETRQAVFAGASIFIAALGLFVVLLFFHDRRTLARLQETTGHVIDQMPVGFITADAAGTVLSANRAAGLLFERLAARKTPVKVKLSDLLGLELWGRLAALGEGRTIPEEEVVLPDRADDSGAGSGGLPVALSSVRIPTGPEDPTAFIVNLRDLREMKTLQDQLRRSERLAALGSLSAGVAHEIRNPLSSIRGIAKYLGDRMAPDSAEAQYAGVIIDEANRLNRVVGDLLAYARPKSPSLSRGDLNQSVDRVLELVQEQASSSGVSIRTDLAPSDLAALIDQDQIHQVILNLVLNAVESGAETVTVTTGRTDRNLKLIVADDGPGVAEADREKIFNPFFTTKAKGSGLGLAVSQRIVEEHGGRLTLENCGPGACFMLTLPYGPDKEADHGES